MALVPFRKSQGSDLARLHRDMDDLFNAFFGGWPTYEHKLWPAIDVAENEDAIVVKVEVPGCKADDIDISVHGSTLTISGEKKHEEQQKEKGYYHLERSYGSFRRDLNLPNDVDTTKIDAACNPTSGCSTQHSKGLLPKVLLLLCLLGSAIPPSTLH